VEGKKRGENAEKSGRRDDSAALSAVPLALSNRRCWGRGRASIWVIIKNRPEIWKCEFWKGGTEAQKIAFLVVGLSGGMERGGKIDGGGTKVKSDLFLFRGVRRGGQPLIAGKET